MVEPLIQSRRIVELKSRRAVQLIILICVIIEP